MAPVCINALLPRGRTEAGSGTDGAGVWMDCCFWSASFHSVWKALARASLERSNAHLAKTRTKEQGNHAVSLETEG